MLYPVELRAQLAKQTPRSQANIGHFVDKTIEYNHLKHFQPLSFFTLERYPCVEKTVRFLTQCHLSYK